MGSDAPYPGAVDRRADGAKENLTEVRLCLLAGFQLTCSGNLVIVPPSGQRLLALLALNDRALSRVYVAGTLWPDVPDERSSANLRSTLWRLPRPQPPLVDASVQLLRLSSAVAVDVREAADAARRTLDGRINPEPERMELWRLGDILLDWYDDWVLVERERFRQLRLHALEVICERLTGAGKFGQAVEAGLAAVASEPLRESAQRVLIRVHLAEGNQVQALKQYQSYRRQLHDELGLQPSAQMEQLIRPVLA